MYWPCERQGSIFLVLRLKSSSGMCAKLHTVAASNNRDHLMRSLYCCLFTPHIFVCCSLRTSHSWWITQSTLRNRRGCNNIPSFAMNRTDRMLFVWRLHLAPPPPHAQYKKMTRDEHVLGFTFKSCQIPIYWWIWMLSVLLNQIWIGIDDFLLNVFTTFGPALGLQVTVLIRVSQIHWDHL